MVDGGQRRTWEYRVVTRDEATDLDALGGRGWELVGVGGAGSGMSLYFKRPSPDFRERVTLDQRRRVYEERGLPMPADGEGDR